MKEVNVYTKVCLPCVMKKNWQDTQRAIWSAGYDIALIRTTYDSGAHKEAMKIWGSDDYVAFVLMPNGEAVTLGKAKLMFENIKDKLVAAGKTKPVRKGKKNVQGLRKAKRSIRVDAVEDSPSEIKVEAKTR